MQTLYFVKADAVCKFNVDGDDLSEDEMADLTNALAGTGLRLATQAEHEAVRATLPIKRKHINVMVQDDGQAVIEERVL